MKPELKAHKIIEIWKMKQFSHKTPPVSIYHRILSKFPSKYNLKKVVDSCIKTIVAKKDWLKSVIHTWKDTTLNRNQTKNNNFNL